MVAGNTVLFILSARGTLRRFEEGQITKQLYRVQFNWQVPSGQSSLEIDPLMPEQLAYVRINRIDRVPVFYCTNEAHQSCFRKFSKEHYVCPERLILSPQDAASADPNNGAVEASNKDSC